MMLLNSVLLDSDATACALVANASDPTHRLLLFHQLGPFALNPTFGEGKVNSARPFWSVWDCSLMLRIRRKVDRNNTCPGVPALFGESTLGEDCAWRMLAVFLGLVGERVVLV